MMKAQVVCLLLTLKLDIVETSFLTVLPRPASTFDPSILACCSLQAKTLYEEIIDDFAASCPCLKETRRSMLQRVADTACCGIVSRAIQSDAFADDEENSAVTVQARNVRDKKPYAPLEALLPATRVRVLINRSLDSAKELVDLTKQGSKGERNAKREAELISELNHLLLDQHTFVTSAPTLSDREGSTWEKWAASRQKDAQTSRQIEPQPLVRAIELLEQSGERRQWNRLKRQEKSRERSNDMRAAFNAYTSNLVFGEDYKLNANKEEKSRMIRTYDQLPDVTSVIRADLDLRDLYRNQVLTFMDDARAEWKFQTKNTGDNIAAYDATELVGLLGEAQQACSEWFKFVPVDDARAALDIILEE